VATTKTKNRDFDFIGCGVLLLDSSKQMSVRLAQDIWAKLFAGEANIKKQITACQGDFQVILGVSV